MLYWSYLVGGLLAYVCSPSLCQQRRSFSLAWRRLCVTPRSEPPFHRRLPSCSENKNAADPRWIRQRAPETRSCEFSSYLNVITDIFLSEFWNRVPCKNGLSRPPFMTAMLSYNESMIFQAVWRKSALDLPGESEIKNPMNSSSVKAITSISRIFCFLSSRISIPPRSCANHFPPRILILNW